MSGKFYNLAQTNLGKDDFYQMIPELTNFAKILEQYYFSHVSVGRDVTPNGELELTIDMTCPFDLVTSLAHFNVREWGYMNAFASPLEHAFELLENQNFRPMDIKELNFFFKDTTLVIKNIYQRSIVEELNQILKELSKHYEFITHGGKLLPYEIYVPVFEEPMDLDAHHKETTPTDYFSHWCIYLDSELDARIYDVKRGDYISANLDFCILGRE